MVKQRPRASSDDASTSTGAAGVRCRFHLQRRSGSYRSSLRCHLAQEVMSSTQLAAFLSCATTDNDIPWSCLLIER
eukprot:5937288-Amphidinium_carterae.2